MTALARPTRLARMIRNRGFGSHRVLWAGSSDCNRRKITRCHWTLRTRSMEGPDEGREGDPNAGPEPLRRPAAPGGESVRRVPDFSSEDPTGDPTGDPTAR